MCAVRPVGWGCASSRAAHTVSRDRMSRLRSLSGSLYAPVRRCEGAGGMWAHSRRESARETRLDPVSGVLRVGWRSRVAFAGAGGLRWVFLYVARVTCV